MAFAAGNIKLNRLWNEADQARKIGAESENNFYINLDQKYNSSYILKLAKNLSLPEISLLFSLSKQREYGLSLLRDNKFEIGSEELVKAKKIPDEIKLSSEAILVIDTFQSAAEAFLYYKVKKMDEAINLLYQAIESLKQLHNIYGYECEIRRIHLARNIIRSLSLAGKTKESFLMAFNLLKYISGDISAWPIHVSDWQNVETITLEERLILSDQVLSEISILMSNKLLFDDDIARHLENLLDFLQSKSEMAKVYVWLCANYSLSQNDYESFLTHSINFFKDGQGFLHNAWKQMEEKLEELKS